MARLLTEVEHEALRAMLRRLTSNYINAVDALDKLVQVISKLPVSPNSELAQTCEKARSVLTAIQLEEDARLIRDFDVNVVAAPAVQVPGDLLPWAIAEFWSSASPGKKVRMLAEGEVEITAWGQRKDFIRWIACSQQPVAAPEDARECLQDVVSHYSDFVAACHYRREACLKEGDADNAAYWGHQIIALACMATQARAALASQASKREEAQLNGAIEIIDQVEQALGIDPDEHSVEVLVAAIEALQAKAGMAQAKPVGYIQIDGETYHFRLHAAFAAFGVLKDGKHDVFLAPQPPTEGA